MEFNGFQPHNHNPNSPVRNNHPTFEMPRPPQFQTPPPMFHGPGPTRGPFCPWDGNHLDLPPPRMAQFAQPCWRGFPRFPPLGPPPQFCMQPPPMRLQNMMCFAPPPWNDVRATAHQTPRPVPPPCTTTFTPPMFPAVAVARDIDPDVVAKANEWSVHVTKDGSTYYYNTKSNVSVWDKPKALTDYEELQKAASNRNRRPDENTPNPGPVRMSEVVSTAKTDPEKVSPVKKKTTKKSRPVSSTPVSGTPWCVVWTSDKKVFFFNPSERLSVWKRPFDLFGRQDVDDLVSNFPDKSEAKPKKEVETTTVAIATSKVTSTTGEDITETDNEVSAEGEVKSSQGTPENNDADGNIPAKKSRRDEDNDDMNVESGKSTVEGGDNEAMEITEEAEAEKDKRKDMDSLKIANASEAESKASKERATRPFEDRLKEFQNMLIERNVSALSMWEKELSKIVFDPRYLLLTSKERRATFDNFVKERKEEERKDRSALMKLVKDDFRKLLEEVFRYESPRLSYNEFVRKYGKDKRFKAVEHSGDRESYFREFICGLTLRKVYHRSY